MKKIKIIILLLVIGITFSCTRNSESNNNPVPVSYYADKDVEIIFENDRENGINVIFMGDAYFRNELKKVNGKYNSDAIKSIECLFNSHPFFEYKNHFNAYIVYAESSTMNYPFGSTGGIAETPTIQNYNAVNDYVFQVKGRPMNNKDLILMGVYGRGGGSTALGGNVAVFGTSNFAPIETVVLATMLHEVGHAFASLGDEYSIPNTDLNGFLTEMPNLDNTNNLNLVKWKHFIGLNGYSSVGVYEGGGLHEFGIWRPESSSSMGANSVLYYNAPSREAIVKKIMDVRGIMYDFNSFLTLDNGNQLNKNSKNIKNEQFERIKCGVWKK